LPYGIAHQNKDILFKVLAENYKDRSFSALGLDLPKIKEVLPTTLPQVSAFELRADGVFLLEDDRILIIDYESTVKPDDFIKYAGYMASVLRNRYASVKKVHNIIFAVVYTGDIVKAPDKLELDGLRIEIKQVFLSKFDTGGLYADLKSKVENGLPLSDEDIMKFIIMPLTEPTAERKQLLTEKTIDLAKQVGDEKEQMFIIASVLVAADKFIDDEYSESIKEWLRMTKVARLYEEEKLEAVNIAVNRAVNQAISQTRRDEQMLMAQKLLSRGMDYLEVMELTTLTKDEVKKAAVGLEIQSG
jgi:hypothetical protein